MLWPKQLLLFFAFIDTAQTTSATTAISTATNVPAASASVMTTATTSSAAAATVSGALPTAAIRERPLRGVHFSAWGAGSTKARRHFLERMRGTVLNAIVIPLKEIEGQVFLPGVARAREYGTQEIAIPAPEAMMRDFKQAGLYTIARIAVFKDDTLPRKKPQWGVHRQDGSLWTNDKGLAWVDPYRREIWEYVLDVASRAAELGFDEIQFDYVRFPSDGDTTQCRYSLADDSPRAAVQNLDDFLRYARKRLEPSGVRISAAVFGMTTTAKDDMGIGQEIAALSGRLDYVSPMMYPSHYAHGEYGLKNPNREPYKIIHWGLRDAKARLQDQSHKLRPYLQDFSLGYHYGPAQVRAQIMAAQREGVDSWLLWNPSNHYTWSALVPQYDPARPSAQ